MKEITAATTLPMSMIVSALSQADECAAFVQIDTPEMAELAGMQVASMRKMHREIDAEREKLKRPFLDGCRGIDDFFRPALARIKEADQQISAGIVRFNVEQKRIADEAAAAARREAEEKARIQREESERIAAEAQQKRERALGELAAIDARIDSAKVDAADFADELARAEAELQQAIESEQEAAEIAATAETAAMIAPVAAPKQASVGMRDHWTATVTDFKALVCAVAADDSLLNLLEPCESALNKLAGALKGAMRIPGVAVRNTPRIATRRGA